MKYDILTENEESLAVDVQASKIVSTRVKRLMKKGGRLFSNGKIYSNSFVGDIADDDLLAKLKREHPVGMDYQHDLIKRKTITIEDTNEFEKPLESLYAEVSSTLDRLKKWDNKFIFNGKFNRSRKTRRFVDDAGTLQLSRHATIDFNCYVKRIGSPDIIDLWIGSEVTTNPMIEDLVQKCGIFFDAFDKTVNIKSGRYPIMFVDQELLFEKISESLHADKYFQGAALYSEKLGQKLFSQKLTISDTNLSLPHGILSPFDGEGVVRVEANHALIEEGIFKSVMTDLRNAKKYDLIPTGNGQRSYNTGVNIGFNKMTIGKGTRTTNEILQSLDKCIVVAMGFGGGFTDSGDFSTPIQASYLFENGNVVGRLPQLTVKSSNEAIFNSQLLDIASNAYFESYYKPTIFSEMDVILN